MCVSATAKHDAYAELHAHSAFTFLDGANLPADLVPTGNVVALPNGWTVISRPQCQRARGIFRWSDQHSGLFNGRSANAEPRTLARLPLAVQMS